MGKFDLVWNVVQALLGIAGGLISVLRSKKRKGKGVAKQEGLTGTERDVVYFANNLKRTLHLLSIDLEHYHYHDDNSDLRELLADANLLERRVRDAYARRNSPPTPVEEAIRKAKSEE